MICYPLAKRFDPKVVQNRVWFPASREVTPVALYQSGYKCKFEVWRIDEMTDVDSIELKNLKNRLIMAVQLPFRVNRDSQVVDAERLRQAE